MPVNLLKLSVLKHSTKGPINSSFRIVPCAKPFTSKTITEKYFLRKLSKVFLKFTDCRSVSRLTLLRGQTPDLHFLEGHFPDWAIPRPNVSLTNISTTKMYYCKFPLSYIFVKLQLIYRTHKADFDLCSTSVIHTQCKADVTYDTEGMQIKILG